MAKQMSLFLEENSDKDVSIYEIYKLDASVYPHTRRYHLHIKFLTAESEDAAMNKEIYLFEVARKNREYLDIREVTREDVIKRSLMLEGQLEACYDVLQAIG